MAVVATTAYLRGDRVRARGEELRDARRAEALLGQTERRTETGTAGTDDHGVIRVIDDSVTRARQGGL